MRIKRERKRELCKATDAAIGHGGRATRREEEEAEAPKSDPPLYLPTAVSSLPATLALFLRCTLPLPWPLRWPRLPRPEKLPSTLEPPLTLPPPAPEAETPCFAAFEAELAREAAAAPAAEPREEDEDTRTAAGLTDAGRGRRALIE